MSTRTARPTLTRCEKLCGESWTLKGFLALVVTTGNLQLNTADGDRTGLVEGDVLLLGPSAVCSVRARVKPCEVLRLEAGPTWTEAVLHFSSGGPPVKPATLAVLRAASPPARRVRQLLRELMLPRRSEEEPSALHCTRAVIELLVLAAEAAVEEAPVAGPSQAGAATRNAFLAALAALDGMGELEEVSLRSFAEGLGLSERQVSRLFRVELDTTFCAYMTRLRVDRARRMLEDSELPVIQIAAATGWNSLGHFNSMFRRLTGRTPTAYRALAPRPQQDAQ